MRTIEKLMKHKLNLDQVIQLEINGHINGCGGKGGFNFSDLIEKVKNFFHFNNKKLNSFVKDLKRLCSENHDVDFALGGNIKDYIKANNDFVCGILKLLNWSLKIERIIIFIIIYIPLTIFGLKYFNWGTKKTLNDLLK